MEKLKKDLTISDSVLSEIARSFRAAMEEGLKGNATSLKMLPSYLPLPTGEERGDFLVLDFGGTNVRVQLLRLYGHGRFRLLKSTKVALRDQEAGYDYTIPEVQGQELFAFLVRAIRTIVSKERHYSMGLTFSYPCFQPQLNKAYLISWTKEIRTSGVEGKEVGGMFKEALEREGLPNINLVAIVNDTVATLLAASYQDQAADIASICGTGHNTCYLEPSHPLFASPMIVNMESGNFHAVPLSRFDLELLSLTEKPHEQRLEKMVSGQYLGELFRLILTQAEKEGCFEGAAVLEKKKGPWTSLDLVPLLSATPFWPENQAVSDLNLMAEIARLLVARSARLVAATYLGTLQHMDPLLTKRHVIAIDGSLYADMPGYAPTIRSALNTHLQDKADMVRTELFRDGSALGAAVAAAMVFPKTTP